MADANAPVAEERRKGILGWIEKTGNKLPDPVFIFVYLILALIAISIVASLFGMSVTHPVSTDAAGNLLEVEAESLISSGAIEHLLVNAPTIFTGFHPLGYVLVVMLGAGVAERSGLFGTAMRASVSKAPSFLLTPLVVFVGIIGSLAADAAYVVLIPLAGVIFAAASGISTT